MSAWLSIPAVAIGVVTFLGAVVIYLSGSKDKGTIDMLNRHSAAQDVEIADLKRGRAKDERDKADLKTRVSALERENVSLAAERPSRERLTELRDLLTSFAAESKQSDAETRALLMAIAQIIEPKDDGA